MLKRLMRGTMGMAVMVLTVALASCGGTETAGEESSKKITYRCLSSSCDATASCNEGDPIPEHCGKHMIR
jgi:hypothetical protein